MPNTPKFAVYKESPRKLCDLLEKLSIESDACQDVAVAHGATLYEIGEAKEAALFDPQIRAQARQDYAEMWKALEIAAEDAFAEDLLQRLPEDCKPN